MKQRNFSEKVSHAFSPYLDVEKYPDMEKYLWERGEGSQRFAFSWLRNRMCLLFSTSAILRCESLFKAELSDFLSIRVKAPKDVHQMQAVVMQMMTGKSLIVFFFSLIVFFGLKCAIFLTHLARCFLRTAGKRKNEPRPNPVWTCLTTQGCKLVLCWFIIFLSRLQILLN